MGSRPHNLLLNFSECGMRPTSTTGNQQDGRYGAAF